MKADNVTDENIALFKLPGICDEYNAICCNIMQPSAFSAMYHLRKINQKS